MSAYDWFLCAWFVYSVAVTVNLVGKPREPLTPGVAMFAVLINLGLVIGLLMSRGAFA